MKFHLNGIEKDYNGDPEFTAEQIRRRNSHDAEGYARSSRRDANNCDTRKSGLWEYRRDRQSRRDNPDFL